MAVALSTLRDAVRSEVRDTELPYKVEDSELDVAIRASMTVIAGKVPLGETWANAAVALTSGSDTATLPSTYELHMVYALRRTSDGHILYKRDVDELERRFWHGRKAATAGHADPTDYALTEDDGVVTVRFQAPVDDEATLDVRRSVIPSDLEDEDDTAPLSSLVQRALVDTAAASLILKLTKNDLDQLRVERSYAKTLDARAASAIHDEKVRLDGLHATGRVQRYVS